MKIDEFIESGTEKWFEYHCNESHDSAHAKWWYHSQQKCVVLNCPNTEFGDMTQVERFECACQLMYNVRFADGFEAEVFEDELLDDPSEFCCDPPPKLACT